MRVLLPPPETNALGYDALELASLRGDTARVRVPGGAKFGCGCCWAQVTLCRAAGGRRR